MFWCYTLQTKNFTRIIEKLKIPHVGYLFDEEYIITIGLRKIITLFSPELDEIINELCCNSLFNLIELMYNKKIYTTKVSTT